METPNLRDADNTPLLYIHPSKGVDCWLMYLTNQKVMYIHSHESFVVLVYIIQLVARHSLLQTHTLTTLHYLLKCYTVYYT